MSHLLKTPSRPARTEKAGWLDFTSPESDIPNMYSLYYRNEVGFSSDTPLKDNRNARDTLPNRNMYVFSAANMCSKNVHSSDTHYSKDSCRWHWNVALSKNLICVFTVYYNQWLPHLYKYKCVLNYLWWIIGRCYLWLFTVHDGIDDSCILVLIASGYLDFVANVVLYTKIYHHYHKSVLTPGGGRVYIGKQVTSGKDLFHNAKQTDWNMKSKLLFTFKWNQLHIKIH